VLALRNREVIGKTYFRKQKKFRNLTGMKPARHNIPASAASSKKTVQMHSNFSLGEINAFVTSYRLMGNAG